MIKTFKTVLLAINYNEEKILPKFIEYYSHIVDKMIFYDGKSTDKSIEIINSYKGHNLTDIEISNYYHLDEADETLFLDIKNNQWKQYIDEYDYAIIVDIDEFLMYNTKYQLIQLINDMEDENATIVKPIGYNLISEVEDYNCKKGFRDLMSDKCCLFNIKKIKEINYLPGAHKCSPEGEVNYFNNMKEGRPQATLLHYKYIGWENYLNRTKLNQKRISQLNKSKGWGVHNLRTDIQLRNDFVRMLNNSKDI